MPRRAKILPFPGVTAGGDPAGPGEPGPPDAAGEAGLAEVRRCDQAEALVVRGLLESAGIPALLRSRLLHSVHPFSVGDQGEVVILVPAVDAVRARRLLTRRVRRRLSS